MDYSGNVKNPFLFDDPAPPADVGDTAANPFLMGGAFDYTTVTYSGINPFSDQIDDSNAEAAGLFGDSTSYPTDMNPFGIIPTDVSQAFVDGPQQPPSDLFGVPVSQVDSVPEDLFGEPTAAPPAPAAPPHPPPPRPPAPTSPVIDFMNDVAATENAVGAPGRPPPPRPPPPSKETKDLLQTVIGAMEATTDTLHEKLTTTRTPCPSPGSGAAGSRSPTPDIQVTSPKKDSDAFCAIFGQTIDMSDHDDDETKAAADTSAAPTSAVDEFDLFGDTPVQKPRTNQDILSLFNKPQASQSPQVDLLSDDLPESKVSEEGTEPDSKNISDLLSGVPTDEEKSESLLPEEDEAQTMTSAELSEKEAAGSDAASATDTVLTSESLTDAAVTESVSPEQVSEKTDSEPTTVIEAGNRDTNDMSKSSVTVPDVLDSSSVGEEKVEAMEVFGSPEPVPPTVNSEHSNSNASSHISTPVKTLPTEPITEFPSTENQSQADTTDAFGVPAVPASTGGWEDNAADAFGDTAAPGEADAFGVIPDAFGTPSKTETEAALFGDVSSPFSNSTGDALFGAPEPTQNAAGLFGDIPQPAPPDSSAAGIFGDVSQAVPPASPANSLFGDLGQKAPPASPAAGLFGDVPTNTSSAFDMFSNNAAPVPAPSGADSTGAALFGSSAPAPNVGMSLFGGGAEPSLDIFAESEGNTMVNPFAPTTTATSTVMGVSPAPAPPPTVKQATDEEFDAFSARFDSAVAEDEELRSDPFASTVRGEAL